MKTIKSGKDFSDQLKKDLKDAKTKEELDALVSSAGYELDDDELDAAAGGEGCLTQCGTRDSIVCVPASY